MWYDYQTNYVGVLYALRHPLDGERFTETLLHNRMRLKCIGGEDGDCMPCAYSC